ncbi:arginine:ornithine antiporter, APA family [Ruaniaceae bacterium KH17]|nr:arginine:ornithine antiporter, APA family [Ruaniaceae bacterium KH17]
MIGAGIFSLPQNMAAGPAAPGALMIGWLVTGVGMLALARTFQYLAHNAKDQEGGLHGYARDGFGPFMGFLSAWGYWISATLGNLAYLVLVFSTLGLFFPAFAEGTNWASILGSSVMLWLYTALLLRGVREASGVNVVVTIAKIVPLVIFLVIAVKYFDPAVFTADFWGTKEGLGSTFEQVRAMMLVTVWAFLGIEGASVYARRAKEPAHVGRATVGGFLLVLCLLISVNLLSTGILSRAELAELPDPALAGILDATVGRWGAVLISIGLIISVSGALLAWMLMCAEILSSTGKAGAFPAAWGEEPREGVPRTAILITSGVLQVALFAVHAMGHGYYNIILMSGSMMLVPYLFSAGYAVTLALRDKRAGRSGGVILAVTIVSTIYALWLLFAGGLEYLLMSSIFYAVGVGIHWWTRRKKGLVAFAGWEAAIAITIVVLAGCAIWGLAAGWLTF